MTIELYDTSISTSHAECDENGYLVGDLDGENFKDDHCEVPPSDVVVYNELRSCADLHRMYKDGTLDINPGFQRDVVWSTSQQSRFIDSLVKQLPIPSMCIAFDNRVQKRIIIDGLQRIATIIAFLTAEGWKISKLDDINPDIAGKTAREFANEDSNLHMYFQRVQNEVLPVNVLRCDFGNKSHMQYIFTIFHRLNTGGAKLTNQEIRNCIYGGKFNDLLKELDKDNRWRHLNQMKDPELNYRFSKQEIILRFFAFNDSLNQYNGKIAKFLNEYMHQNQDPADSFIEEKRQLFERVVSLFLESVYPGDEPASRTPTSVMEAVLVAIARNIDYLETIEVSKVRDMYYELRNLPELKDAALAEGLAKKDKVQARLNAAISVFDPR